jgi:glycosyltransferase involved in cell wall biosynthesis
MRICILSSRFPPQRCGIGDYTYFLACALARIGHDVDVLTAVGELDESLNPLPSNVRVHRLIRTWGLASLSKILRIIQALHPNLLLIQYAPTAYDRRGVTLAVNLLAASLRAVSGIRVMTNFHEIYTPFGQTLKRDLGAFWQRAAALLLASGSHSVSATALDWERCLKHIGVGKPINVVPVGSNIPLAIISETEREEIRAQLLGGRHGLLLAGFGAQHDRDIPAALYGLRRLKKLGPARLIWIGGGTPGRQYKVSIESALRENGLNGDDIEWTGVLPHPDVSRLLSSCDLMLLPFVDGVSSRRTSAIAALQHGLPLLTTRGAVPEPRFVHEKNVYLLPTGDRQALADGLLEMAQKPEMRKRLAEGGRALYTEHFTWEAIAQEVARLAEDRLNK